MDKRSITAILLITVLFIVYTLIFNKPKPGKNTTIIKQQQEKLNKEPGKITTKKPAQKTATIVALPTDIDTTGKLISVRTKLFTAKFTTTGARLQSLRLLKYLDPKNKPVELIPKEGYPLATTILKTPKSIDLSKFPAICNRDSIIITNGSKDSLIFYFKTNDTLLLKKVFVFYPDKYTIDLHIISPDSSPIASQLSFDSGIASTEKDKREELSYYSFVTMLGKHFEKRKLRSVKDEKENFEGAINWTGLTSKYFLFAILPKDTIIEKVTFWRIEKKRIGLSVSTKKVPAAYFALYFGPMDYYLLKSVGRELEKSIDFGWKWIAPISKVIFFIFTGIHKVIHNYGVVIILFSTIMMVVFFPLTIRSFSSMRKMQKLQPKMEALRKKYKDDPQKMNAEIMKLYSQNKVNPFGGCLPLLFQMPVFFALYAVLRSTIELRRSPFVFWIKDLSMRDPYFILPILMGIAMFFQQKFTVTDPRQKTMTYFMPLFLVFIFARLPSGIVLYWLIYNLLSIFQQYIIHRSEKREEQKGLEEE